MNIIINRTDTNEQLFELKFDRSLDLLIASNIRFYHHSQNYTNQITTMKDYKAMQAFEQNSKSLLLYKIHQLAVGTETIEAINIKTQSEIVNYQGEKVDVRIF